MGGVHAALVGYVASLDTGALLPWYGTGTGLPWGSNTYMAQREAAGLDPWVTGCSVQPLVGGYPTMCAIRDQLENMISAALTSSQPPGQRGLVYLADWRMNGQRDLSDANTWGTGQWTPSMTAANDQTVLGLLMRLMYAGVVVRVLLWMPVGLQSLGSGDAHVHDHVWIATVVAAASNAAKASFAAGGVTVPAGLDLGLVALDARVTNGTGSHHQKFVVMRGGTDMLGADGQPIAVAFVGGVDLAFTRRDAPGPQIATSGTAQFQQGDWQSAITIPAPGSVPPWPQAPPAQLGYSSLAGLARLDKKQDPDLYTAAYGDSSTSSLLQIWHDQHLVLRGPIVEIIEGQFVDRWMDAGIFKPLLSNGTDLSEGTKIKFGQVMLSSADAILDGTNLSAPLPDPKPVNPVAGGTSTVQMWRTIPDRRRPSGSAYADHRLLFADGEFTVLAGFAHAASQAQHLIWIFDQYFWSQPYARLLNTLVNDPAKPDLNVIVILPAHSDSEPNWKGVAAAQHRARREALGALVGVASSPRISVWNLWDRRPWRAMPNGGPGLGIYVHAKAHTYDGSLLVCGSANINRRSLTGDSELACAVLDPATVTQHQHDRWQLLFPGTPWPTDSTGQAINLDAAVPSNGPSPGTAFHTAFMAAAASATSFLIPDQWTTEVATLPNGVQRDGKLNDAQYSLLVDQALESTSIPMNFEAPVRQPSGLRTPATLADVAARIARCHEAAQ